MYCCRCCFPCIAVCCDFFQVAGFIVWLWWYVCFLAVMLVCRCFFVCLWIVAGLRCCFVCGCYGTCCVFINWRFGVSIVVGGLVCFANFYLLYFTITGERWVA